MAPSVELAAAGRVHADVRRAPGAERQVHFRRRHGQQHADRRDDPRVVGMGDHVPEFILRSFRLPTEMPPEDESEEVGEAPDVEEMPETVDASSDS